MPNGKTPKELGYETQDVQWPLVIKTGVVIVVFTVISVFGLAFLFQFRDTPSISIRNVTPTTMLEPRTIPSGPLLQASPPVDMAEYKGKSLSHLENFGWVDEASGKVHIPIERAIELALEQGYPTGVPEPVVEIRSEGGADEGVVSEAAPEESDQ